MFCEERFCLETTLPSSDVDVKLDIYCYVSKTSSLDGTQNHFTKRLPELPSHEMVKKAYFQGVFTFKTKVKEDERQNQITDHKASGG